MLRNERQQAVHHEGRTRCPEAHYQANALNIAGGYPMSKAHEFSIGGWCLVSSGSDPFGGATRSPSLEAGLEGCAEAGIRYASFHDGDLWED